MYIYTGVYHIMYGVYNIYVPIYTYENLYKSHLLFNFETVTLFSQFSNLQIEFCTLWHRLPSLKESSFSRIYYNHPDDNNGLQYAKLFDNTWENEI